MTIERGSNRFHFLRILSMIALTVFVMIGFSTTYITAAEGEKKVTIIHTNDIHAQIDDFGKLAAYKKKEEAASDILLYVDAGDIFSGNPVVDMNKGEPIVNLLNQVGLDFIGIGNHEYDYGVEELNKRVNQAEFDFLSANTEVVDSEFKQPKPYEIIEVDGVSFGFISLTQAPPATAPKNIEGIDFHEYHETIEQHKDLREKVDVLIAVNHIGLSDDRKLAQEFDIFDAIIGGHSHTEMKKEEVVNDTTIVQTGSHLNNIGNLTITLDSENNIQSIDWILQSVEELTEIDEDVQKSIDTYNAEMEDQLKKEIGETVALNRGARYERDTSLGNFWTDALRRVIDDSDIAFTNNGGIRADIPAGTLTYGDIYNIEPFANEVMAIEMTGDAILNVLEYSFTRDGRNQIDLQTSGLEYVIHLDAFGDLEKVEATVNGDPLGKDETYTVVVPDYIGTGGSGYNFAGDVITGKAGLMTDAMIDYAEHLVKTEGKIDVEAEGRIQIKRDEIDSLTIAEAITNNEGRAIVTGYVVGQIDESGKEAILLADNKDETDSKNMLAVEITTESNTKEGFDSISALEGKILSVAGTLGTYNNQPGIIDIEGMKLLNLVSITEAKGLDNDTSVTIEGVVLADSGAWGSEGFYVHDTTGGIYVYQGDYKLEEGDFVRVTGKKGEHDGEVQISAVSSIEVLDKNHPLPDVRTVTIDEINKELVGELIRIKEVTIDQLNELDYGTFEFQAKDDESENPNVFRVDNRTGLSFKDFIFKDGDTVDVIGIVGLYGDTLQVKPRKADDIIESEKEKEEPTEPEKPTTPEPTEPEEPKGPENPKDDGEGTNGKVDNNGEQTPVTGDPVQAGDKLPKTATNTWNMLAIGGVLFIVGSGLLFIYQRKRKVNQS